MEAPMELLISNLVSRFEQGALSRRELIEGLALLAASGTAAVAAPAPQTTVDFTRANIDHVSIKVADMQRSMDFYQKMFGFTVVSEDKPGGIVRLGNNMKVLVSINNGKPASVMDHYALGIPGFNADAVRRHVMERGSMPLQGDYAGLHIKDPDGVNVQISGV
jgi:catechol 2,3-dioxygenase-like lactoylglutathione lyase family enzyme